MKKQKILLGVSTWLVILLLWQALSSLGSVPKALIPSPASVLTTFRELVRHGYAGTSLANHFLATMYRLFVAVLAAILLGVPLGLLSGYFLKIRLIVDSIIQFIRPIPPLAYYTLLILWLGITDTSKISLLFIAALAPIYLAAADAVKKVPQNLLNSAASLGADKRQIFFHVVFPASLPAIFTGIRIAVGVSYSTTVAAEMVAASNGIGWMIIDASRYLKSSVMFVGIIILGLTGILLDQLIQLLARKLTNWSEQV